jgi:hypothetical protein
MRRFLGLLVALAASLALFALNAGSAVANHVHCGDVITQDTTLDGDLVGCSGDGIVIDGDHVKLDLNGHTIAGQGSGVGVVHRGPDDAPYPWVPEIEVANGSITGFAGGVGLTHVKTANIHDLRVTAGLGGIGVSFTVDPVRIANNEVRGGGIGVSRQRNLSQPSQIAHNVVRDGGIGGYLSWLAVRDNLVRGGDIGVEVVHGDADMTGNRVIGTRVFGVEVASGSITFTNNLIADGMGLGAWVARGDLKGDRNVITRNAGGGVGLHGGGLWGEDNQITHNGGAGISGDSVSVTLTRATVSSNRTDGIALTSVYLFEIRDSTIDRNGGNGIILRLLREPEYPPIVSGNHLWWNGALGLDVPAETLGGGNWAKHNGNPLQCVPAALCSTKGKPKA